MTTIRRAAIAVATPFCRLLVSIWISILKDMLIVLRCRTHAAAGDARVHVIGSLSDSGAVVEDPRGEVDRHVCEVVGTVVNWDANPEHSDDALRPKEGGQTAVEFVPMMTTITTVVSIALRRDCMPSQCPNR